MSSATMPDHTSAGFPFIRPGLEIYLFATQMCLGEDQRNTNSKGHDKLINTGSVKVGVFQLMMGEVLQDLL